MTSVNTQTPRPTLQAANTCPKHVEVIVNDMHARTIEIASDLDIIQLAVSVPFIQFLTWSVNMLVLNPTTLSKCIADQVRKSLVSVRGEPLYFSVLVLNHPNDELRKQLNKDLAETIRTVSAEHAKDTVEARKAARDEYIAQLYLHFSPDRVGTFISRVMREENMTDESYECYRILLSAGIQRAATAMLQDVDEFISSPPNNVGLTILCRLRGNKGQTGTWFWSSPWCAERVVEYVMSM